MVTRARVLLLYLNIKIQAGQNEAIVLLLLLFLLLFNLRRRGMKKGRKKSKKIRG